MERPLYGCAPFPVLTATPQKEGEALPVVDTLARRPEGRSPALPGPRLARSPSRIGDAATASTVFLQALRRGSSAGTGCGGRRRWCGARPRASRASPPPAPAGRRSPGRAPRGGPRCRPCSRGKPITSCCAPSSAMSFVSAASRRAVSRSVDDRRPPHNTARQVAEGHARPGVAVIDGHNTHEIILSAGLRHGTIVRAADFLCQPRGRRQKKHLRSAGPPVL